MQLGSLVVSTARLRLEWLTARAAIGTGFHFPFYLLVWIAFAISVTCILFTDCVLVNRRADAVFREVIMRIVVLFKKSGS